MNIPQSSHLHIMGSIDIIMAVIIFCNTDFDLAYIRHTKRIVALRELAI